MDKVKLDLGKVMLIRTMFS